MMRRWGSLSSIVILVALLVGCTSSPIIQATGTPTIQMAETATRKPSPTFKSTSTLKRTWTPIPTNTINPADITEVLKLYRCYENSFSESPSKKWRIYTSCHELSTDYDSTALLINQFTRQFWSYPYCKYDNPIFDDFCPTEGYLYFKAWSPDENYLYTALSPGGPSSYWFGFEIKLISINLHNGFVSVYRDSPAVYEFSPGVDLLAYIPVEEKVTDNNWEWLEPDSVFVRDLRKNNEFKLKIESGYNQAGDLVWSPDGTQFVFLAIKYDDSYDIDNSTLMLVDVISKRMNVLIKDYPGYLDFEEWGPGDILKYRVDSTEQFIYYSISEQQMITTPQP